MGHLHHQIRQRYVWLKQPKAFALSSLNLGHKLINLTVNLLSLWISHFGGPSITRLNRRTPCLNSVAQFLFGQSLSTQSPRFPSRPSFIFYPTSHSDGGRYIYILCSLTFALLTFLPRQTRRQSRIDALQQQPLGGKFGSLLCGPFKVDCHGRRQLV